MVKIALQSLRSQGFFFGMVDGNPVYICMLLSVRKILNVFTEFNVVLTLQCILKRNWTVFRLFTVLYFLVYLFDH